jgi:hypothetical protein
MLPVIMYGCQIWSFTLREAHKSESVLEQGAEENIWTQYGWNERSLKKNA